VAALDGHQSNAAPGDKAAARNRDRLVPWFALLSLIQTDSVFWTGLTTKFRWFNHVFCFVHDQILVVNDVILMVQPPFFGR
jgi:hypothetical protein